jgi:hemerythrin
MFQDKVIEKIKKIVFNNFPENRDVYELKRKKLVEPDRPHENVIRRMRLVCWMKKATDTQSEYVTRFAVLRKQWLREHALMLRLYVKVKVKVNFTLEQTTKAHKGSEGIAVLFL